MLLDPNTGLNQNINVVESATLKQVAPGDGMSRKEAESGGDINAYE